MSGFYLFLGIPSNGSGLPTNGPVNGHNGPINGGGPAVLRNGTINGGQYMDTSPNGQYSEQREYVNGGSSYNSSQVY